MGSIPFLQLQKQTSSRIYKGRRFAFSITNQKNGLQSQLLFVSSQSLNFISLGTNTFSLR
jgi:hypothetical protein